ncbi:MAG TPA: ring-cleaving dioxygenase [Anaerolineales bacterium]
MQLTGLHHVTAITARAAQNVDFYTQVLGLRLVKKTVNQDDVSAYHLFYADAIGSPGTDVTFFDWPHVVQNRNGAGSIAEIGLRVPDRESLEWWAQRLAQAGVDHRGVVEEAGRTLIRFSDPEGQALALVNDEDAPGGGTPWERSPVPAEHGIRGLNSVKLMVEILESTASVLTEVMGFRQVREVPSDDNPDANVVIFETGRGGPGTEVHVEAGPHLPPGRQGRGGVHHVAFRTPNDEEQVQWRQRISQAGLRVTDIIDRYYFKSIYFREPGGILFEIATDGPGFAVDEDVEHLGEQLALPPFLEPHREQIEANLHPLEVEEVA